MAGLIETSSIFSQHNLPEAEIAEERLIKDGDTFDTEIARIIDLRCSNQEGALQINLVMPDTLVAIYYYSLFDCYMVGQISDEIFFEHHYYSIEPVVVTSNLVLLRALKYHDSEEEYIVYTTDDRNFKLCDIAEFDIRVSQVTYKKKNYTTETSETEEPKDHVLGIQYTFPNHRFYMTPDKGRSYVSNDGKKIFLTSTREGALLGYIVKVNKSGNIVLMDKEFEFIKRLTLVHSVVRDIQTQEEYLLTCVEQVLLPLSAFGYEFYDKIPVVNGILVITQVEQTGNTLMHVFTPNHQRIVLEHSYKINSAMIGNGLLFQKDNVVILDNGSLSFVKKVPKEKAIFWKNRKVLLPVTQLGEDYV